MAELVIKSYTDENGKRTTLRFDPKTWQAIRLVASKTGLSWAQWVHRVPSLYESRTTDVRAAVVEALLDLKSLSFKGSDVSVTGVLSLLGESFSLTDDEFAADIADDMSFVDKAGPFDFGAFTLRSGYRQGKHTFWIGNGVRDMPNIVIPIPDWVGQLAVFNNKEKAKAESAS